MKRLFTLMRQILIDSPIKYKEKQVDIHISSSTLVFQWSEETNVPVLYIWRWGILSWNHQISTSQAASAIRTQSEGGGC